MTNSRITDSAKIKEQIVKMKRFAAILDKGLNTGSVKDSDIEAAQDYINKVGKMQMDAGLSNRQSYIVYEVQALLDWINQDEEEAIKLAVMASEVKGDDRLYTENGRGILDHVAKKPKKHKQLYIAAGVIFLVYTLLFLGGLRFGLLGLVSFIVLGWAVLSHARFYSSK